MANLAWSTPVEKFYLPGRDRPWILSAEQPVKDALIHVAYVPDPTQRAPRTVRYLCGADWDDRDTYVTHADDSNCLHCVEEARKRWHI